MLQWAETRTFEDSVTSMILICLLTSYNNAQGEDEPQVEQKTK